MNYIKTEIPDVWVCEPKVFADARGYFMETWRASDFNEHIGHEVNFVQDNQSMSSRGVLRGLHFQKGEFSQAKLVRVLQGTVVDVAVDVRQSSPTFGKYVMVELSAENKRMLFIPRGFGHGFVTLTDDVEFCYKVDNLYSRECDRGIRYNDPAIGVDWGEVNPALLSQKDTASPLLEDSDCNFVYGEI